MTTEEFIEKARKVHGDKFDYSKSEYIDNQTNIIFYDKNGNKYIQSPLTHLKGFNPCGYNGTHAGKKFTQDEWIELVSKKYNYKYDYKNTVYKSARDYITALCPKHGEFTVNAHDHLHEGCACHQCKLEYQFIERAKKIHGDKYDYSKVNYVNNNTDVCIICPEHGEFWVTPNSLLNSKKPCPLCRKTNKLTYEDFKFKIIELYGDRFNLDSIKFIDESTIIEIYDKKYYRNISILPKTLLNPNNTKINHFHIESLEQFLLLAEKKYKGDYDYSKVYFTNEKDNITVICPKHGEFITTPKQHIKSKSKEFGECPKCLLEKKNYKFIEQSIRTHGTKYIYSDTEYKNLNEKVCIICPKHGKFWQTAKNHIHGKGCPKCTETKLEEKVRLALEKNNIIYKTEEKIDKEAFHSQRLDFYLPEYNIAIECQGEQHFKPIDYFDGEKGFSLIKERDIIKKNKCENQNIKLFYFTLPKFLKYVKENNLIYNETNIFTNIDILIMVILNS